jgi:hypothetical protein
MPVPHVARAFLPVWVYRDEWQIISEELGYNLIREGLCGQRSLQFFS